MELLPDAGADDDLKLSSSRAVCAPLLRLLNSDKLPGSRADAAVAFDGGQEGPLVQESLDAMGSPARAAGLLKSYRTAVRDCDTLTLAIANVGKSKLDVGEVSFADLGDDSSAGRFTATTVRSKASSCSTWRCSPAT